MSHSKQRILVNFLIFYYFILFALHFITFTRVVLVLFCRAQLPSSYFCANERITNIFLAKNYKKNSFVLFSFCKFFCCFLRLLSLSSVLQQSEFIIALSLLWGAQIKYSNDSHRTFRWWQQYQQPENGDHKSNTKIFSRNSEDPLKTRAQLGSNKDGVFGRAWTSARPWRASIRHTARPK